MVLIAPVSLLVAHCGFWLTLRRLVPMPSRARAIRYRSPLKGAAAFVAGPPIRRPRSNDALYAPSIPMDLKRMAKRSGVKVQRI
eukprot:gene24579-biopygen4425